MTLLVIFGIILTEFIVDLVDSLSILGSQTIYLFKANNDLINSYDGGDIKKDWLKEHNPKLQAIIVYPDTSDNLQEEDISSTEKTKPTEREINDYSEELFSKFTEPFIFSSGVGSWGTTLQIKSDGSFID